MLFKKKTKISVDVIEFSGMNVSTGQVGEYIKNLYEKEKFRHIGYRCETNKDGFLRFVIFTLPNEKAVIQYFKDRCSGMVEEECRKLRGEEHEFTKWQNGFEEIKC